MHLRRRFLLLGVVVAVLVVANDVAPPVIYVADPPAAAVTQQRAARSEARAAGAAHEPTPSAVQVPDGAAQPPPAPALHATSDGVLSVGLGDSVMAGSGCDCDGIMAEYARQLAALGEIRVSGRSFGVDGSTTQDALDELASTPTVRSAVSRAGVVVVTMGANDLRGDLDKWHDGGCDESCYQPDVAAMGARLASVLEKVDDLSNGRAEVLVTNYWNVFTDGQLALDAGADELRFHVAITRAANHEISVQARAAGARLVDLVAPFKGAGDADPTSLLASDGDHPNAAGVKAIAAALVAVT